ERVVKDPGFLLELMDRANIEKVVLISYPAPAVMGYGYNHLEFIVRYAEADRRRLLVAGSIDPHEAGETELRLKWLWGLRVNAIKLHPVHQLFKPNAYREEEGNLRHLSRVYQFAQTHQLPLLIHTGTSVFPGSRIKYGDPMFVEDVATDYPRLKIVMCHGGRPLWCDTAFFLVRKHPNLYFDISGTPPEKLLTYYPRLEVVADKVVFGTDWASPGVPSLSENIQAFMRLPLSEDVKMKILHGNASRLLEGGPITRRGSG
ncbi:MAG: amidohydrolase family protein, partial [Candidatus Bathyarchaeia archaeon]